MAEATLVQLRKHQVFINGHEQSAVGVYWVSDGVDRCLVGFLPCHQVKNLNKLEGALCQVMEVYSGNSESPTKCHKHKKNSGCAIVVIVSSQVPNKVRKAKKTTQSPPKLLQTWKHIQTPKHNPQSKRDPSEMQQKRAGIQKIGNYMYKCYEQNINFHVISSVPQLGNQDAFLICVSFI